MKISCATELNVYKRAYVLAMEIFESTTKFPAEERFALVCQIRRSSRSVCMNLREAWAKRRYEAAFINKLTDCDGEINETDSSLSFACDCRFISKERYEYLVAICSEVRRMLGAMLADPYPFLIKDR